MPQLEEVLRPDKPKRQPTVLYMAQAKVIKKNMNITAHALIARELSMVQNTKPETKVFKLEEELRSKTEFKPMPLVFVMTHTLSRPMISCRRHSTKTSSPTKRSKPDRSKMQSMMSKSRSLSLTKPLIRFPRQGAHQQTQPLNCHKKRTSNSSTCFPTRVILCNLINKSQWTNQKNPNHSPTQRPSLKKISLVKVSTLMLLTSEDQMKQTKIDG